MVATSSLAASSGKTPSGHAVCIFHRIGCCAVAEVGALYEPARKATRATIMVNAIADLKGTSLRMGHPSVERRPAQRRPVEVFAASEKWRESMQCGCALSIPLMRAVMHARTRCQGV